MAGNSKQNNSFILTSMTDLMTSLAVIFILLLVMYLNRTHIDTHKRSEEIRQKLIEQLKSKDVHAKLDPLDKLSLIIRVDDDSLSFDTDDDKIKRGGEIFLVEFIPKLTEVVCGSNHEIESILIQGFTDSEGDDNHNLGLSQKRARAVMLYSLDKTPISRKHKDCLLNLTSTNGKGERGLLSDTGKPAKSGEENKTKSRRVEFKIRVKSYEQRKIIEQLQEDDTPIPKDVNLKHSPEIELSQQPNATIAVIKEQKEEESSITVSDDVIKEEPNAPNTATVEQLIIDFNNKLKGIQASNKPTPFEFRMISDIPTLEGVINHNMEIYIELNKIISTFQNQLDYTEVLANADSEEFTRVHKRLNDIRETNEKFIESSNQLFSFLIQNDQSLKPSNSKLKLRWSVDGDEKDSIQSNFNQYLNEYQTAISQVSKFNTLGAVE
jgi:outer membrane protein OmpA-like peptidoglycan-associated protein